MFQKTSAQNASCSNFARVRGIFVALAFFICFACIQSINAATYTVTNTLDSGAGSLRQAVLDANGTAANDIINFNIPITAAGCVTATGVCTITLASEIIITNNGSLTINGTGANRLTIDGGAGTNRIFSTVGAFNLSGVTLTGGNGAGGNGGGGGGAVFVNGGTAVVKDVHFLDNSTGSGGGIFIVGGTNHRIENSAFSGNTVTNKGGAIYVSNASLTVVNSTISGNTASDHGGGIYADGTGTLTLRGATITANTGILGGGVYRETGTLDFGNSIIAGNISTISNIYPEIDFNSGTAVSQGYNLVGDSAGDSASTGTAIAYQSTDLRDTPPLLDPLANYGGTVPTRRLQATSPAIDKGSLVAGITTDGRGVIRPYDIFTTANATGGSGADIGAFELIPTSQLGWGINNLGQVGDGTTTTRTLPTQIAGGFTDIVSVEGGSNHALGLFSNGTLMAWGSNSSGQLGDNTTTGSLSPVAVVGLTNVVAMVGGGNHSLALLADGTVWAWGSNINGQLGNQGTNNSLPAVVSGITNAVAVAAVANTSYALLADGSVVAWGRNSSGQLGDGTTTPRSTPGQVSGLTGGVISIEGGGNSCYAVLSDGSVVAWGNNSNGQLGDGTIINRLTPVPLLNLTSGVVQVAGGFFHAAALKSDGTLLTWGGNSEGQLGDGTIIRNSTPTAISLANVTQIKSSLGNVTYARLRDGSLFAWGANFNGAVGNGTTATAQTTPVRVSTDAGIGFFGAFGNGGYAGSPLAPVAAGANQFVRLGDATVNFLNVASAGTLQVRTFDPSLLTNPTGYTIELNSNGYDITSTAGFTGNAQVCLKVSDVIDLPTFNKLTILHDDNFDGVLDAVTVTRNYQKREVCRVTQSFSPFVLAQSLAPLAANVTVSGRITVNGAGLRNAVVSLTDMQGNTRTARSSSFGYYQFEEVEAGQTYTVSVISKRFQFAPQIVSVVENVEELNFIASP